MVTRINGFSSGLDIDTLVKQLMDARRIPLDKIMQKKQTLDWRRDAYREVNRKVLELKNSAFTMKLQSTYMTKKTSSADESIITATATANATDGVYKLNITQLAEAASANSSGAVTTVPGGDEVVVSNTIAEVDATVASNFSLIIGGEKGTSSIQLESTNSLASFMTEFNSKSGTTGVKVSFDDTMKRFFFVSSSTGEKSKVELNSTDANFLTNVLKVSGTTPLTGETITGSVGFMTTPPDVPDLSILVDGTLTADQTLRINYLDSNFDFVVSSTTTIGNLLTNINSDIGFQSTGIVAGIDDTTGVLTFGKPDSLNSISFTDMTSDSSDIVSSLGLPAGPTSDETVTGAAYLSPVDPYVDPTIVINSGIAADQTFRIKYDLDGNGTSEDYDFTISNTTTIGSLINSINTSDLGKVGSVNAQLDSTTGNLIFTTPDNTKHFDFSDATVDGDDIISSLGLTAGLNDTAGAGDFSYSQLRDTGLDAMITYNTVSAQYSSNTFTINGVNFTAKKASGTDVNILVSQDVDKVYDSIKTFVDKYNEILSGVNVKLSEQRYRDYAPLTSDQRSTMEESEIKLWEDNAKSGLLRSDSILSGASSGFRSDWYQSVSGLASGEYSQLAEIGISTLDFSEKGKLYINEAKLREALSDNPEAVMRLFTSDDGTSSTSGDGVAVRIYNAAENMLSKLKDKAGTASSLPSSFELGVQTTDLNKQLINWQRRLEDYEEQYYRQFTAMEVALNKYNAQSSYLAQLTEA